MKNDLQGFIELDAQIVQSAAFALKAEIIVERGTALEKAIAEVKARKKPSGIRLFLCPDDTRGDIMSADTDEEAIAVLKKSQYAWFDRYTVIMEKREASYQLAEKLIRTSTTVIQQQPHANSMMMIDLTVADILTKYFE